MKIFGNLEAQKELNDTLQSRATPRFIALTGPTNLGKFSYAKGLLDSLLDEDDIFLAEGKIDDIRKAIGFSRFMPSESPFRIVLINDADKLGLPAQDALLKICEAPPAESIFIIIVSDLQVLSDALRSRIQKEIKWCALSIAELSGFADYLGTVDERFLKLSGGKPGLYKVFLENPKLKTLYSEIRETIISPYSALQNKVPSPFIDFKKSELSFKEAVAHMCAEAVKSLRSDRALYANISHVLSFSSTLVKNPSINAEVHWMSTAARLSL